jgi:hypothetical protein
VRNDRPVRVEASRIREAIELIDTLRPLGYRAGLADTPGAWDVAVERDGMSARELLDRIAPVLARWVAAHDKSPAAVHIGERLYIVPARAPATVRTERERSLA